MQRPRRFLPVLVLNRDLSRLRFKARSLRNHTRCLFRYSVLDITNKTHTGTYNCTIRRCSITGFVLQGSFQNLPYNTTIHSDTPFSHNLHHKLEGLDDHLRTRLAIPSLFVGQSWITCKTAQQDHSKHNVPPTTRGQC